MSFLVTKLSLPCSRQVHSLFTLGDLRQTIRRLVRERGFTMTVLLTLALCIAANVAIFAARDAHPGAIAAYSPRGTRVRT